MKVNIQKSRIKENILQKIKSDSTLKAIMVRDLEVSLFTVERWLRENHRLLTTNDVLEILQRELRLKRQEILERPKQKAV